MASEKDATCENDPNFGIICAFFQKFSVILRVPQPNICLLKSWLENRDEVPADLKDLHIQLLRKCLKKVDNVKWERALVKFCRTYSSQDAWEIERFGYKKSRLKVKLRILKEILETQFELNAGFRMALTYLNDAQLRDKPLGRDKLGHAYWLTQDLDLNIRIYQELLEKKIWQVVASNRDEFDSLISRLKYSSVNDSRRKKKIHVNIKKVDKTILVHKTTVVPARQSSRIAQLKMREEAELAKLQEITKDLEEKKEEEQTSKPPEEASAIYTSVDPQSISETQLTEKLGETKVEWGSDSDEEELQYEHELEAALAEPVLDHEFYPEEIEDDSQVVLVKRARTAKQECDNYGIENYDGLCQKCGKNDHPQWILLCDKCAKGYHCSCLIPVLFTIPEGDWYCPPCEQDQLIKTLGHRLFLFDKEVRTRKQKEKLRLETLVRKQKEAKKREAQEARRKKTKSKSKIASASSSGSDSDGKPTTRSKTKNQVNGYYYEPDDINDSDLEVNNNFCAEDAKPTESPANKEPENCGDLQNVTGTAGTLRKSLRGKNKLYNILHQKAEDPNFAPRKRYSRTSNRTPLNCIANTMEHKTHNSATMLR